MPIDFSIFNKAAKAIEEKKADIFTSLAGSSKALFFSIIKEPCLLLCKSEDSAREFHSDAVFWSKSLGAEEPLLIQPKGDFLRLKNLSCLYSSGKTKVIVSAEAASSPIWDKDKFPLLKLATGTVTDRVYPPPPEADKSGGLPAYGMAPKATRDFIIDTLKNYDYLSVPIVSAQGELSIRGGILDVFPPGEELPLRIEFFGDEIESIRIFDTDTQRAVKELKEISICPVREPDEGPSLIEILKDSMLILNEPDDIKRQHPELFSALSNKKIVHFTSLHLKGEGFDFNISGTGGLGLLREERKTIEDFVKRTKELRKQSSILMVCSSEGQAKRLKELFAEENLEVPVLNGSSGIKSTANPVIVIGEAGKGFVFGSNIILTERDMFGEKPVFRPIKKSRVSKLISSIEDFKEGDYLVHTEHGIGKFLGLRKQTIEDYEGDFIVMEYLEGDRLYVPLERIHLVHKYHAPESIKPRIDKLGGKSWQKTRQRIKQKIKDMAERLLALYAKRSTAQGHAFHADTELHREFDGFFQYDETPDQLTAITEIKHDMENQKTMDRLLCGDVGYGKTEVVMRACFKAVYDSKQAAVLVPTTILAEQHYETFMSRFSAFPIRIDFLSRFKSKAEQKQTIKALADGNIDIIIGTHRILAKDVTFYNLGLLVIDEEHKFGVAHKEKIKGLKTNVDILTLSATPIPRTLHMALSGIRAMSVIETPPEDRLAVKSFVARFNPETIREALQKELDRDGQIFFVHNRVQDIFRIADFLKELAPSGRIAVAHGQMKEKELEHAMHSFFKKETNILVSTAIIGAGLDIPSANTIIINRADKFGLADLYQLRGRVGRSNIRAFAYFLIPGEDTITEEAGKKLQAIQELSYLGAGFRLALSDLRIRGAGNLLGSEQSGHIETVGFDLYMEMLEQAVAEIKGEAPVQKTEPLLDLKITAMIPESYVEDPDLRLGLYRKIYSAKDSSFLREFIEELKDRFGPPPDEALRLVEIMELKLLAKQLAVTKIQNTAGKIRIVFAPETTVTPGIIFSLYPVRKKTLPELSNGVCKTRDREVHLKFLPEGGIEMDLTGKPWNEVFIALKNILEELATLS